MAHLITASAGQAHITPKSDASWHRGMMGVESCILDFGEKLAPALVPSQPTNIRILDGCGMMQGRFFEIEEGSYDTVAIPNGAQGYNRIDIVCAKITQNENGTQTFSWEVVQGTQTSETPQPPTVAEGSLDNGDSFALMPIASVELEGVSIVAVETVSDNIRKVVPLRENEFVEVKKLLWTNLNPESGFSAQAIPVDLTGCTFVEVIFRVTTSNSNEIYIKFEVGEGAFANAFYNPTSSVAYLTNMYRRIQSSSETEVEFDSCYTKRTNSESSSTNDSYMIPYIIYGIKHI